ncbi:MAG: hypothetical protein LBQ83_04165 [Candidatus Margulisbacteria bacterium]|jgi:3-methyladenine DNA glycosylase AlkC|nr:hypothetical protein [Candidatus Margulisiibacteriota bacterium]
MPIEAGQPIKASEVNAMFDTKENISNKVTVLSSESTTAQYPSAKTVHDNLTLKENTSNKVTALSSTSTHTQYPSAKTVYDNLILKENANKKKPLSPARQTPSIPRPKRYTRL